MIVTFVFVIHRIRCFVTPRLLRPGVGHLPPVAVASCIGALGTPSRMGPLARKVSLTVDLCEGNKIIT